MHKFQNYCYPTTRVRHVTVMEVSKDPRVNLEELKASLPLANLS